MSWHPSWGRQRPDDGQELTAGNVTSGGRPALYEQGGQNGNPNQHDLYIAYSNCMIYLLFQYYVKHPTYARLVETASPEPYDLEFYLFEDYDNNWFVVIEGTQLADPQECVRELRVALGVEPLAWCVLKEYHQNYGDFLPLAHVNSQKNKKIALYCVPVGKVIIPYALLKVKPEFNKETYGKHY